MRICLLYFLSILLFSANSFASTVTVSIASSATAIPQKLIDNGINNVGSIDLQQLVDDIKSKVRFAVLPVFTIGAGTYGSRRSGSSCHAEDHTVYLNQPHLDNIGNLEVIEALLLHESLCALGFVDDNYVISSTLGSLRRLSKRPANGGPSDAEKLISNPQFISPFIRKLAKRTMKQVFTLSTAAKPTASAKSFENRHMLEKGSGGAVTGFENRRVLEQLSGGTVTGVGGGGDGFALYLKMLLFQDFEAFFSLCEQHRSEFRITLPQAKNNPNIFDIDLICYEPRLSTWWSYFFSLSVETAYIQASSKEPVEYPNEMPALGSFILEPQAKGWNSNDIAPLKITIDSFRWGTTGSFWNNNSASTIFMTMMLNYYPTPNARATQLYPVFEFKGKKEYVDAMLKTFSYATGAKCTDPSPDRSMDASFKSVPLQTYISRKATVPPDRVHEAPNCFYLLD